MKLSKRMREKATFKDKETYPEGETLTREATIFGWANEVEQLEATNDTLTDALEYALETLEVFETEGYENDDFSAAGTRIIVREAIAKSKGGKR